VAVGLGPRGNKIEVSVSDLLSGKKLLGGYFANQKSRQAVQNLVEKYVSGNLPIDPLITHRFKLDQINEAFDLLKRGKTVRSIIEF
jgi:S-(hydroxymethyl)glutathione dehydrogenase/alcohol dehydrogenase